ERQRVAGERRVDLTPNQLEVRAADAAEDRPDHDLPGPGLQTWTIDKRDRPRTLDDEGAARHPAKRFGAHPVTPVLTWNRAPGCGWAEPWSFAEVMRRPPSAGPPTAHSVPRAAGTSTIPRGSPPAE